MKDKREENINQNNKFNFNKKKIKRGFGCCFIFVLFLLFFSILIGVLTISGYSRKFVCSVVVEDSYLWNKTNCIKDVEGPQSLNVDTNINNDTSVNIDNSNISVGDIPSIVEKVSKSVVGIGIKNDFDDVEILGTGFIISDGEIVTNQHVVSMDNVEYFVKVQGEENPVRVSKIHRDNINDLAILEIEDRINAKALELYTGDLKVGQDVLAIGNPLGQDLAGTVTRGIISGLNRSVEVSQGGFFYSKVHTFEGVIQTDAAINPGNSGGPLLDMKGRVIGINFATVEGADNLSFALPIKKVVNRINELKQYGEFRMPFLGVNYREKVVFIKGDIVVAAIVVRVAPDSPAEKAGIVKGDIIVGIDSKDLSEKSLADVIQEKQVGDKITLNVLRDKKIIDIEVIIGSRAE